MEAAIRQSERNHNGQFQEQLQQRIHAAQASAASGDLRLGLMLGPRRCLLDLGEAAEIINDISITPVPFTQNWCIGLANWRGDLISVIDLACFCGLALPGQYTQSCGIVLPKSLIGNCAFRVSHLLGLHDLRQMRLQAQHDHTPPFGRLYLDRNMAQWAEISFAAIVADARFLHMVL